MEKIIQRDYYLKQEVYYFLPDEVSMYPLSFSEFMTMYEGNRYDGRNEYTTFGYAEAVLQ